ncbi:MAG: hypothetical protein DI539_24625 [Flavobacterium psychrophilum]|nr:MAG: hypothetical protein DI539_24625 [Flavobacterium psychrophilum]
MDDYNDYTEVYEGDGTENGEDSNVNEYDISASPNDFNLKTLFDFIQSGIVKIPGFQRNYVWDIRRASKLIESIIIGIPIPQIFLFEEERNKFIVIDGQQRYMTIYYFMKKRFPKSEKRFELRNIFDAQGGIPDAVLNDNDYFVDFNLQLTDSKPGQKNRYSKLNYFTLEEADKTTLELRTIRNVIIKQNSPDDGNTVVFEIFNRLNSGGVNLKPQEIRTSLFHSNFYNKLYSLNLNPNWRQLTPQSDPDLHMKDIEILLRGFGMLTMKEQYSPSMIKFLNSFSLATKKIPLKDIEYLADLFIKFVDFCSSLDRKIFFTKSGRFNISVYESIFYAVCKDAYDRRNLDIRKVSLKSIEELKSDPSFVESTQANTTNSSNVTKRLDTAYANLK